MFRVILAKIVAHMVEAFLVSNAPARRMRARFIQSFSTVIKNLSVLIETHTAAILPSAEVRQNKVSKQTLKYIWPN
jgi:hypothetical protein